MMVYAGTVWDFLRWKMIVNPLELYVALLLLHKHLVLYKIVFECVSMCVSVYVWLSVYMNVNLKKIV